MQDEQTNERVYDATRFSLRDLFCLRQERRYYYTQDVQTGYISKIKNQNGSLIYEVTWSNNKVHRYVYNQRDISAEYYKWIPVKQPSSTNK